MTGVKKRVLVLGGTAEARALAGMLIDHDGIEVISSLAGRTQGGAPLPGKTRLGGFGGAAGLRAYLRDQSIAAVVDATHPFAERISENAKDACDGAAVPRLYLARPAWRTPDGADTETVATIEDAAKITGEPSRRVFLTIGNRGLEAFLDHTESFFLVRTIEKPHINPPANWTLIQDRPPYSIEHERDLMVRHAIDTLVTKSSGGSATAAKIGAATDLGVKIVQVARPASPPGEAVETPEQAARWVLEKI